MIGKGTMVTLKKDTPLLREKGCLKGRHYSVLQYYETAMGDYVEISLPRGVTACIPIEAVDYVIHQALTG